MYGWNESRLQVQEKKALLPLLLLICSRSMSGGKGNCWEWTDTSSFVYQVNLRHAGNQFNDKKHLPTHHFLNIGRSCILQDLCCRIPTTFKNWFTFEHIVLFTVYKGRNQPVMEYISKSNEILLPSHFCTSQAGLIVSIAETT